MTKEEEALVGRLQDFVNRGPKQGYKYRPTDEADLLALIRRLSARCEALEGALWGFDYCPKEERRSFFCAGCDMDGMELDRAECDELHDTDCRAARVALRATPPGHLSEGGAEKCPCGESDNPLHVLVCPTRAPTTEEEADTTEPRICEHHRDATKCHECLERSLYRALRTPTGEETK